nr:hypothetical protein [Cressdnaviricota sp.]
MPVILTIRHPYIKYTAIRLYRKSFILKLRYGILILYSSPATLRWVHLPRPMLSAAAQGFSFSFLSHKCDKFNN